MAKEKVTKTSVVIRIMTENKDKSMSEVVKLIEKGLPCKDGYGKVWYRWAIKEGVAPGKLEDARSAKAASKPAKAKTEKPAVKAKPKAEVKEAKTVEAKPKGNRFTGKVKATATQPVVNAKPKNPDDLAKIKAANLKRMQDVTAKMKKLGLQPGQYANPENVGVPEGWTAEGARAEVDQMYKELDSFEMPKFLSKDQVKALV